MWWSVCELPGRPWLFGDLVDAVESLNEDTVVPPREAGDVMDDTWWGSSSSSVTHIAVRDFRKHAAWYLTATRSAVRSGVGSPWCRPSPSSTT